jgi:hypothetical protein
MSERKVLNKYFGPKFDPKKPQKRKAGGGGSGKVRLMAPFSMQCTTCGDFIYKSKKFNAKKEVVFGEDYLGIEIMRFYIRCPLCAAEITFKTDPKNTDYVAEKGAIRTYEPWRDQTELQEQLKEEREYEEENNPMKALENRTLESKREMDILDALDEIRSKNSLLEKVDASAVLDRIHQEKLSSQLEAELAINEQDLAVASAFFRDSSGELVKRISATDDPSDVVDLIHLIPPSKQIRKEKNMSTPKIHKPSDLGIVLKPDNKPSDLLKPASSSLVAEYDSDD